ncbi:MAG TPA: TetR/AcrR family transcriptional regulator [Bacteroidales bacterium]|nr:MAG: putative HTH-type transcriptional regulator YvdT [Bacteroidetes bacterium ADurb.Bin012]HQQ43172.1 TetR/AcrR family transcriptional regulator [Bacteroidales bacterium]
MRKNETESKQKILEAAEAEFFEKGFGNAKTVSIAKRAGISHTMLHYYYSTKEELFQRIFKEKVQLLSQMFNVVLEQNADFTETLRLLIETQFNFVAKNPQLPMFIFREILSNEENRQWAVQMLYPHLLPFLSALEKMFNAELSKGTIRPVTFQNLLMNVISLNISVFIALPILKEALHLDSNEKMEKFLVERRESNVQFILNALRR